MFLRPYFAKELAGGGEHGLSLSGLTVTLAGIATALTAPFLGVIADKAGRRKPPIAFFMTLMFICSFSLWWARPDGPADHVADHGRPGGGLLLLRLFRSAAQRDAAECRAGQAPCPIFPVSAFRWATF
jgi:MFS family permease